MNTEVNEKPRARRPQAQTIRFVMSHAEAALALSISERKLDEWVAQGRLTKRRLTDRTVGYLVREVEALAESLPPMTPGIPP